MEEEIKKEDIVKTPVETPKTAEAPAEAVAPKGIAALRAKMMERKPDEAWNDIDDDGMADMAMADYDELSATVDQYKQRDAAFDELAEKHPQGMMFLSQLAKGKSIREAIENSMDASFDDIYNDPDYPKAKEEREAKERAAVDAMLAKLDEEAEANGWKPEEVDEALQAIDEFISAVEGNAVTFEMLQMLHKGKRYDKDVAKAQHDGEVAGRNAKIEEGKRKKKASSDGLPALGGMAKGGETSKTISRGGRSGVGSSIWNAANMQRKKYD